MKKWLFITSSFVLFGFIYSKQLLAADLMTVYQDALSNDPTFQTYRYQWLADKEYIGVTRSALLPQISLSGDINRGWYDQKGLAPGTNVGETSYFNNQAYYQLSLSQTIFNYTAWEQLQQAGSLAKSSAATYMYGAQNLIYRTANAYFYVLQTIDILRYTRAYKEALYQQLDRSRERYKVGLVAITDVDQAEASYDTAVSEEITAKNNVDIAKEQLRAITNKYYSSYATLTRDLPLMNPQPANIDEWVKVAERQNYEIAAAMYAAEAAHDNIKAQAGSSLPVITAQGNYDYTHNSYNGTETIITPPLPAVEQSGSGSNNVQSAAIGLYAEFPVVQGGRVISSAYQAQYQYQKAAAQLTQTQRNVISSTKQSYLSVISGIGVVKADKQAVVSNTSALNSTTEGYLVGTQTMVDVLTAEANLYNAQKQFTTDQYNYIMQTVLLKENTGVLSYTDLQKINAWLKENYQPFSKETMPQSPAATTKKPAAAKKAVKATPAISAAQEVLAKDPKHFTIQLYSSKSQQYALAFSENHRTPEKGYIVTTYNNAVKQYIFIAGDYKTQMDAQTAANKLTKIAKPWIRTFGSVQVAMSNK